MATKFTIFTRNGLGELVKESFAETSPNARPFILMRAGYSGAQRNGSFLGVATFPRSWGGLQSQPDIVLQMGLQRNKLLCTVIWEVLQEK